MANPFETIKSVKDEKPCPACGGKKKDKDGNTCKSCKGTGKDN